MKEKYIIEFYWNDEFSVDYNVVTLKEAAQWIKLYACHNYKIYKLYKSSKINRTEANWPKSFKIRQDDKGALYE